MAFFDDIVRPALGVGTLGLSELVYFQPKDRERMGLQQAQDIRGQQLQSKQTQLGLLNQMRRPEMSQANLRRIQALEEQAQDRPLSQDPYFQGQRTTLVTGGREALADVQNQQRAYGVGGGFRNIGSVSDIQDRLGAQLAQLGGQAIQRRDMARDAAAEARQNALDAQVAYDNAVVQAKIAIEAGDAAGAQQAINMAYAARQAASQAQSQALGQVWGTAATVGGSLIGGPAGAMAGQQVGQGLSQVGQSQGVYSNVSPYAQGQLDYLQLNPIVSRPYAYSR